MIFIGLKRLDIHLKLQKGLYKMIFTKEMQELYNNLVGWGKMFAPNEEGCKQFIKFAMSYTHHNRKDK